MMDAMRLPKSLTLLYLILVVVMGCSEKSDDQKEKDGDPVKSGNEDGNTDSPCLRTSAFPPVDCRTHLAMAQMADIAKMMDQIIRLALQASVAGNDYFYMNPDATSAPDQEKLQASADLALRRLESYAAAAAEVLEQQSEFQLQDHAAFTEMLEEYRDEVTAVINDPRARKPISAIMRKISVSAREANQLLQTITNEIVQEETQSARVALRAQRATEIAAAASAFTVSLVSVPVTLGAFAVGKASAGAAVVAYIGGFSGAFDSGIKFAITASKLEHELSLPANDVTATQHKFEQTLTFRALDNGNLIFGLATNGHSLFTAATKSEKILGGLQVWGGFESTADKASVFLQENPEALNDLTEIASTEIEVLQNAVAKQIESVTSYSTGNFETADSTSENGVREVAVPAASDTLTKALHKLDTQLKLPRFNGVLTESTVDTPPAKWFEDSVPPENAGSEDDASGSDGKPDATNDINHCSSSNSGFTLCVQAEITACPDESSTFGQGQCPEAGKLGGCKVVAGEIETISYYYGDIEAASLQASCVAQGNTWLDN